MLPTIVLINPWIYDFAAYDLWSKPLGLLYLASYLRRCGFEIHIIDCLDIHFPGLESDRSLRAPVRRRYGTGKFRRTPTARPAALKGIPRPYSRYGIPLEAFQSALEKISSPSAILVTSLMTYWYPGVQKAIELSRKIHPRVPVILGGIYARLCLDHARRYSGADKVEPLSTPASLLNVLGTYGIDPPTAPANNEPPPYPAFDALSRPDYICLLTSTGCPYRCRYCASRFLNSEAVRRNPAEVFNEILYWHKNFAVRDFAFYDDALLLPSENHLASLLEKTIGHGLDIRFHTPNALHVRGITPQIAELMYRGGFRTIRLGLETAATGQQRRFDNKISAGEFEKAVRNLTNAGFQRSRIGVYLLVGLPGQPVRSVREAIEMVSVAGAVPFLAEYSPIPHTDLWETAISHSGYDISSEPLFHNNTLLPCWDEPKKEALLKLKERALQIRDQQQNASQE
jgi:hypothetical protein